jgi:hypothetical protein
MTTEYRIGDAAPTNAVGNIAMTVVAGSITPLTNTPGAPVGTRVNSAAYEASHILKASAGKLIGLFGYNSGPAQFYQLHDSATLPADAAVPALTFTVPTLSNFSLDLPPTGLDFIHGIVVCNSSTGPTKTIGSGDSFFTAEVI